MISAWKIILSKPAQGVKWPVSVCDEFNNTVLEKISAKVSCFYFYRELVTEILRQWSLFFQVNVWMCCSYPREQKNVQLLDVVFYRRYNICVTLIEDHVNLFTWLGIKLHDSNFAVKMHLVVCGKLWAYSLHQQTSLWLEETWSYKTRDSLVNTSAVSFSFVFESCFTDWCATLAFIRCCYSTRLCRLQHFIPQSSLSLWRWLYRWRVTSLSCATVIFATVSITSN
jgi:hypothetical protein